MYTKLIEHFDPMVIEGLTENLTKQLSVIQGLLEGKPYREIGEPLGMTASTVRYFQLIHFPTAPSLKPDGSLTRKQRDHALTVKANRANRNNLIKQMLSTKTYREIAAEVGCSIGTVNKVATQLKLEG